MRNCSKVASRFAQIGRSMIEMLGVLAIIGVLSVGGIAGYEKAMMQHKINISQQQIVQIVTGIQELYANERKIGGHAIYSGKYYDVNGGYIWWGSKPEMDKYKNMNILIKSKVIPESLVVYNEEGKAVRFKNAFGGHISFMNSIFNKNVDTKPYGTAFMVGFFGLPLEACIALASHDWTTMDGFISMGFHHYLVPYADECASGKKRNNTHHHCKEEGPMSVERAISACSSGFWQSMGGRALWLHFK